MSHRTLIASHRGGSYLWPENSLMAFRETAKLAVDQVEFDVQLSADGECVVIHDPMLGRTNVSLPVCSSSSASTASRSS